MGGWCQIRIPLLYAGLGECKSMYINPWSIPVEWKFDILSWNETKLQLCLGSASLRLAHQAPNMNKEAGLKLNSCFLPCTISASSLQLMQEKHNRQSCGYLVGRTNWMDSDTVFVGPIWKTKPPCGWGLWCGKGHSTHFLGSVWVKIGYQEYPRIGWLGQAMTQELCFSSSLA